MPASAQVKQKLLGKACPGGVRTTKRMQAPSCSNIQEVTEDSSATSNSSCEKIERAGAGDYSSHPAIQEREYTSLPSRCRSYGATGAIYSDTDSCCSASDEMSSSSSGVTNKMSGRQLLIFLILILNSFSSSLTVCLFPPFYPRLAEMKGTTATDYGLIIGTNCLVAFIVTPFVGNHLPQIGVKYAFCFGTFAGGVCCALSGLLEFFEPGQSFIIFSVLVRITHAVANALVITSTFAYQAMEFPSAVAKVFSITRCVMNVTQLVGPVFGGVLHEIGGFFFPFVIMGSFQVVLALSCVFVMPPPYFEEEQYENNRRKKEKKVSIFNMLSIPTIWFSFGAFIIATMCNGFLSVNLEPEVLRQFSLSPIYIGLIFGLKDGANSIASPVWGWICDSNKKSVKPYLIGSSVLVTASFLLLGGGEMLGILISLSIPLLVVSLSLNGVGIGGQQVVGVVDALHEANKAGYPDNPATQGLVAGMWSSLSGAGRFISRAGSGILVDQFGFNAVACIAGGLQLVVALCTFLYLVMCECSLVSIDRPVRWEEVTIVDRGRSRDDKVVFSSNSSPSESLMTHAVLVGVPNRCSRVSRIANSMPPRKVCSFDEVN